MERLATSHFLVAGGCSQNGSMGAGATLETSVPVALAKASLRGSAGLGRGCSWALFFFVFGEREVDRAATSECVSSAAFAGPGSRSGRSATGGLEDFTCRDGSGAAGLGAGSDAA